MVNRKNRKIVIVILSLLIACLVLIGTYSYYNYSKDKQKNYELLDVNNKEVADLFYLTRGDYRTNLFYGTEYYNIYYKEDKILTNELNENFKKLLAYYTLDKTLIEKSDTTTVFSASNLKKQYINIFGDDIKYVDDDIYCDCPLEIIYLPPYKQYVIETEAYGMMILERYDNKIIEVRKYEDKIEIYEKVVFFVLDDNTGIVSYYRDSSFKEKLMDTTGNKQFNFDDYEKQCDTYKYTFTLKNDLYYFSSVERIK